MGARFNGIEEVAGSTPASSTKTSVIKNYGSEIVPRQAAASPIWVGDKGAARDVGCKATHESKPGGAVFPLFGAAHLGTRLRTARYALRKRSPQAAAWLSTALAMPSPRMNLARSGSLIALGRVRSPRCPTLGDIRHGQHIHSRLHPNSLGLPPKPKKKAFVRGPSRRGHAAFQSQSPCQPRLEDPPKQVPPKWGRDHFFARCQRLCSRPSLS